MRGCGLSEKLRPKKIVIQMHNVSIAFELCVSIQPSTLEADR